MELSIIVAVYGVERYIDECMRSIVSQLRQGVEVIVVSDHSTDRSVEICKKYAAQYSGIRIVEHEVNRGISAVRNTGISQARGRCCWFVDGDDRILPGAIDFIMEMIASKGVDTWFFGHERFYTKGEILQPHPISKEERLLQNITSEERIVLLCDILKNRYGFEVWNKIFSMELIQQHGLRFPEDSCYGEDLAFLLCYMQHCRALAVDERCVYRYVLHERSMMAESRNKCRLPEMIENAAFVWEHLPVCSNRSVISSALLAQGVIQSWGGDIPEAVRSSKQKDFLDESCNQIIRAPIRIFQYHGKRFSVVIFLSAMLVKAVLRNDQLGYRLSRFLLLPLIREDIQ